MSKDEKLMAHDPLSDADAILRDEYYGTGETSGSPRRRMAAGTNAGAGAGAAQQPKPTHYKVICISMYTKDLEQLDELVEKLKTRGITKANRSALIRVALEQLDLDRVPRGL